MRSIAVLIGDRTSSDGVRTRSTYGWREAWRRGMSSSPFRPAVASFASHDVAGAARSDDAFGQREA